MAESEANTPPKKFAPIGPGNHDRAWNDPPMFATEFNVTGKAPANKLNKRVAYPISSSSSTLNSSLGMVPPGGPPLLSQQPPPNFQLQFQQPPSVFPVGGLDVQNGHGSSNVHPPPVFQPGSVPANNSPVAPFSG